jgi:hypothetical protein
MLIASLNHHWRREEGWQASGTAIATSEACRRLLHPSLDHGGQRYHLQTRASSTGLSRNHHRLLPAAGLLTLLLADQPLPDHRRMPVIVPRNWEGSRMNIIVTVFLLILGGILLVIGFDSSASLQDEVSRVVVGRYSDRTFWFIGSGAVCFVLGLVGIFRSRRA